MNFETIMQAYNTYKAMPAKAIEARAQAIQSDIASNPNADIQAYGIELEGIERALEEKSAQPETRAQAPAGIEHTAADAEKADDPAGTPEYRRAFYRYLQGHQLTSAEKAAFDAANVEKRGTDYFNDLSNAAAVVPTQTLNEIIVKARDQGGFLSTARGFNMPANISIPIATPGEAASWHVEGDLVNTEKVSPTTVSFAAYEIMRILSISAATRVMSIDAFESYLSEELASSIMAALAKGSIDGTGSGQATGVISGITWKDADEASASDRVNKITVAADEALAFTDILDAIALLHRGYSNGAKFYMNNRTLYQDVYGIHDEVNRPVYVADLTKAGAGRIMGFDVVLDDYMDDHEILFGNAKYYGFNLPSGIALDVSRESSFKSGLVDYRGLAIADAKPIVDEAFVMICKADSEG